MTSRHMRGVSHPKCIELTYHLIFRLQGSNKSKLLSYFNELITE